MSAGGRMCAAGALVTLAVALAAGGGLAASDSGSASVATRVIDGTYTCMPSPHLGRRWVVPFAQPGVRAFGDKTRWHSLASVSLHTGTHYDDLTIMGVGAGSPQPTEGTIGLSLNTRLCRARAPRIALSSRGLQRFPVSPLGEKLRCPASEKVVVRIRAVFLIPTTLRRGPFGIVATSVPVRSAAIAVRAQNGTPLLFGEVSESGRTRLFTSRGCEYF